VSRRDFCVGLAALVRGTVNIDLIVTNETVWHFFSKELRNMGRRLLAGMKHWFNSVGVVC
jgi:hypothetical protein